MNVNLIFTAKAAYGLRETVPIPAEPLRQQIPTRTPEEIVASYGMSLEDINSELPEPSED